MEVFARELDTPIPANIHWGFQAQNDEGMSPLLLAASYGHVTVVKELLQVRLMMLFLCFQFRLMLCFLVAARRFGRQRIFAEAKLWRSCSDFRSSQVAQARPDEASAPFGTRASARRRSQHWPRSSSTPHRLTEGRSIRPEGFYRASRGGFGVAAGFVPSFRKMTPFDALSAGVKPLPLIVPPGDTVDAQTEAFYRRVRCPLIITKSASIACR